MVTQAIRGTSLIAVGALVLAWGAVAATPALAAPVDSTIAGVTYTADDTDVNAGARVTAFDGSETTVNIPDKVDIGGTDYDVVAIDDEVFKAQPLDSVIIGDNVTTIGVYAFGQSSMTSLSLGNSVTTIGADAFQNNGLTGLNLPGSLTTIGDNAFTYNELTDLTLPNSVTTVGGGGFSNNELGSVTLSDSLTTIETYAFTDNNLSSVTLPDSVITIDAYAFRHNELINVTLSESLTTIGYGAFMDNDLTSLTVPASVTNIKGHAFSNNPGLESVIFNGPPPAPALIVGANEDALSFDASSGSLVLTHAWRYGDPQYSGGFTSPTYQGYDTQAVATVDYNLNGQGGTAPANEDIVVGGTATEPTEPSAAGYVFTGWYTDNQSSDEFDFTTQISGDITLYAGWEALGFLTVSKTVDASFVRVYSWDLDKAGTVGEVTVGENTASAEVDYAVTATPQDVRNSYHVLSGTITVTNETVEAMSFTIADELDVGINASCDVTLNGEPAETTRVGAQGSITFDYACDFVGIPEDGTNTATVSWFGGEEQSSVTEDVVFSERDSSFETVTVVDDETTPGEGWTELGDADWNADGIPTTFSYTLTHGGLAVGECTTRTNTAMIIQTEQAATANVEVCPEVAPAGVPDIATPESTPPLATTGVDIGWAGGGVLLLLLAGGAAITISRRVSRHS